MKMHKITNAFYAHQSTLFINACNKAGILNTSRQASKFQRGMGLAYKVSINQIKVLKDNKGIFIRIINQ